MTNRDDKTWIYIAIETENNHNHINNTNTNNNNNNNNSSIENIKENNNNNSNNNNNEQENNKRIIVLDDKEWKRREFILAECNELLIRLMERLDAIRPKSAILGEELAEQTDKQPPTELEEAVILEIRNRKRKVIRQIEQNFKQLDHCKELLSHMNE
ncbi:unnamed protein product [Cunninghamella blakesleeana]